MRLRLSLKRVIILVLAVYFLITCYTFYKLLQRRSGIIGDASELSSQGKGNINTFFECFFFSEGGGGTPRADFRTVCTNPIGTTSLKKIDNTFFQRCCTDTVITHCSEICPWGTQVDSRLQLANRCRHRNGSLTLGRPFRSRIPVVKAHFKKLKWVLLERYTTYVLICSRKTAFVDKGFNMATKTNSKTISTTSGLRTRKLINYRNLNNMGIVETTNNNATMIKTSNKNKSDQSRSSKKSMPNNSLKKKATCMGRTQVDQRDVALQETDTVNQISSLPTGDGVIVTVHAPMGEFEDDEENISEASSMTSDDDGDKLREVPEHVEPNDVLTNDNPDKEMEEEILAWYGNNPHFKNLMQHLLKSSIQGQSSQTQLPSTSDVRNVECHDEAGAEVPFQQSQPMRK